MTTPTQRREFQLAVACCRWPLSANSRAAVQAGARGAIDWAYFLRIVMRQRIAGLVHNALADAGVAVPAPEADELAVEAQRIARHNLMLAAESERLEACFDGARIPAVFLKGVALAQLAYGSLSLKHGKDIDLMVPPARALEALRLLEAQGYTLSAPALALDEAQRRTVVRYGNEFVLDKRGLSPQVDLRWRLTDNPLLVRGVDPFRAPREVVLSGGARLRTLGEAEQFAYLCVHGASHAWSRLKWLADVGALLAQKSGGEIEALYRTAQQAGAGICAGLALLMCRRLLALSLPARLDDELRASRRLARLSAGVIDVMVGADAATANEARSFGSTRVALMQFMLGRGPAYWLAQARVVSVRLGDVVRYPLPRPLHFLYPLLRLPLWLWRRARRFGGDAPLGEAKRH